MATKRKHDEISLIEAVEVLAKVANRKVDLEALTAYLVDLGLPVATSIEGIVLDTEDDGKTLLSKIGQIFRVILHYIKNFYENEYPYMPSPRTSGAIKGIMVLVGEAASQLDKFPAIVSAAKSKKVTESKEYKLLQEFYLKNIAHKINESEIDQWLITLSQRVQDQQRTIKSLGHEGLGHAKHLYVDMDSVKKDNEYELFWIRKEDGKRFFSPVLVRNLQLACDFENRIINAPEDGLELDGKWLDRLYHVAAKQILAACTGVIDRFHKLVDKKQAGELAVFLSKALMALLLGTNAHFLMEKGAIKHCRHYFQNFQEFLRQALQSREYVQLMANPPKDKSSMAGVLLDVAQALCRALFIEQQSQKELLVPILDLIKKSSEELSPEQVEAYKRPPYVWHKVMGDYAALSKLMKHHPHGPLIKILEQLEGETIKGFDPLMEGNLPSKQFVAHLPGFESVNIRLPCPTMQEVINQANITPEFNGFLRTLVESGGKHLLINLQDRTHWREYARCHALEECQHQPDLEDHLIVVTIPGDLEGVFPIVSDEKDNHAEYFIKHLSEQLMTHVGGFYFPESVTTFLTSDWFDSTLQSVHKVFFGGRNVMLLEHRRSFLQIFSFLIEWELLKQLKPTSFSLTCKDGIDVSPCASALFFLMLRWLEVENVSADDLNQIDLMLYAASIVHRHRLMRHDCFESFQSAVKVMETIRNEMGWEAFGKYMRKRVTAELMAKV